MFLNLSFLFIACQESNLEKETLEGKEFILQESEGFEQVDGTEISLVFENESFSFHAGCNSHSSEYSVDEDTFISQDLASTMMACEEPLMVQEAWVASFFSSSPSIDYSEPILTLENEDATLVFAIVNETADIDEEEEIEEDPEEEEEVEVVEVVGGNLINKNWIVDGYFSNGEELDFGEEVTATFLFQDDGNLSFFTGCNTAGGTFTIDSESQMTIIDGAMTLLACGGNEGAIESHMLSILLGQVTYSVEDDHLVIENQELAITAYTLD